MQHAFHLHLDGEVVGVLAAVHKTLLKVLREDLQLSGTKPGGELGECDTCTVLLEGTPTLACLLLPIAVQDQEILTIEGMALGRTLHGLQNTCSELRAAQCGYCTPEMLLTAMALLWTNPMPDRQQIQLAPRSLHEAVAMIAAQEPNTVMLMAGGTDVYPNITRQQYELKTLIGLRQLRALHILTGTAQHGLSIGMA